MAQSQATTAELHAFLYSLIILPTHVIGISRWDFPVMCYLSVWALKEKGTFQDVHSYTPELAKWEYLVRALLFREAYNEASNTDDVYAGNLVAYVFI